MYFFDTPFNQDNSLSNGDLLLAEPFLEDVNFDRTVILLCQYDEKGAFGLVLNRPTEISVSEATELSEIKHPFYVGGPVEQDVMHFIHTMASLEGAVPISEGLFWGGDTKHLRELALQGKITDKNCRFFVGYSGWGAKQLDDELSQNTWIISKHKANTIFNYSSEELWRGVLKEMGGRYSVLANYPSGPRLN